MQCLDKPYIKKSTRVIPNLLPHACSLVIFTAALIDADLHHASPAWFNNGWQYIGVIAIVSCFIAAIESINFFCKLGRFDHWKKKSTMIKLLSELVLLIGSIILLLTRFDNLFPALFTIGFFGLGLSKLLPQQEPSIESGNNCLSIFCKNSSWFLALLLFAQSFSTCVLTFSVNDFATVSKELLRNASFIGMLCSLTFLLAVAVKLSLEKEPTGMHSIESESKEKEIVALK